MGGLRCRFRWGEASRRDFASDGAEPVPRRAPSPRGKRHSPRKGSEARRSPRPPPAPRTRRRPRRPRGSSRGARSAGAATHLHEVEAGQEGDAVLGHLALLPLLRGHAGGGCGRRPRGSTLPRLLAAARRGSPPPAAAAAAPSRPLARPLRRARGWRQEAARRRGEGARPRRRAGGGGLDRFNSFAPALRGASEQPGAKGTHQGGALRAGGALAAASDLRLCTYRPETPEQDPCRREGVRGATEGVWGFYLVSGKSFSETGVVEQPWEYRSRMASVLLQMYAFWDRSANDSSPQPQRQAGGGVVWLGLSKTEHFNPVCDTEACGFCSLWSIWCSSCYNLK